MSQKERLNLRRSDCKEMSWLQYTAYRYYGDSTINRSMALGPVIKSKSDYVEKALTNETWEKIFLWPNDAASGQLVLEPHGGRMGHIAANDTPFPHRSSVLYNIQYVEHWNGKGPGGAPTPTPNWIGSLYDFMAPFVSKNPRAATSLELVSSRKLA